MIIRNLINKKVNEDELANYTCKAHRSLRPEILEVFRNNGEGLYYATLKRAKDDIISRAIGKLNHDFTHTILILYKENVQQYIDNLSWLRILSSLSIYYDEKTLQVNDIKVLVLSTADSIGMVCCDFSNYQNREFVLRKFTNITPDQEKILVNHMTARIGDPYDATGLVFWWTKLIWKKLFSIFDSDYEYCSESVYDAAKEAGIKLAKDDDPSPWDIENYNAFPIILDTRKNT